MPTMKVKIGTTSPAFAVEDYSDFDIPATFALISPVGGLGMRYARLYVPHPWISNEIRFYDFSCDSNGVWSKMGGSFFINRESARENWRLLVSEKWTPQNVIENPLNGNRNNMSPWDLWAAYFAGHECFFSDLIRHYGNNYPRKMG